MALRFQDNQGLQALDPNQIIELINGNSVVSGVSLSINTGSLGQSDTVQIASGTVIVGGSEVSVSQQNAQIDSSDPDNPRRDVVYIDSGGNVQVDKGSPEDPEPEGENLFDLYQPAPPDRDNVDGAVVGEVFIPAGNSSISSSEVRDRRLFADASFGQVDLFGDFNLNSNNLNNVAGAEIDGLYTGSREPDVVIRKNGSTVIAEGDDSEIDSGSNAATVIQNGIDSLSSGGVVLVTNGTYTLDSTLQIPSNMTLKGTGENTVFEFKDDNLKSLIELESDNEKNIVFRDFKIFVNFSDQTQQHNALRLSNATGTENVLVENLIFDDQSESVDGADYNFGIQIHNTSNFVIKNCNYPRWTGYPIEVEESERGTIQNVDIDSEYYGISPGTSTEKLLIEGCRITAGAYGIRAEGLKDSKIKNCDFYDTTGNTGLFLTVTGSNTTNRILVEGCLFDNCSQSIHFAGDSASNRTKDIIVTNSKFVNCTAANELINNDVRNVAFTNNIIRAEFVGLELPDSSICSNNTFLSNENDSDAYNKGQLIRTFANDDITVANNNIDVRIEAADPKEVLRSEGGENKKFIGNNVKVESDDGGVPVKMLNLTGSTTDIVVANNSEEYTGSPGGGSSTFGSNVDNYIVKGNNFSFSPNFNGSPSNKIVIGNIGVKNEFNNVSNFNSNINVNSNKIKDGNTTIWDSTAGEIPDSSLGTVDAGTLNIGSELENNSGTLGLNESNIDHDSLSNFVSNEHIDHSSVTITGTGALTGGGDLTSSRTLDVASNGIGTDELDESANFNFSSAISFSGGIDGGGSAIDIDENIDIENSNSIRDASGNPHLTINDGGNLEVKQSIDANGNNINDVASIDGNGDAVKFNDDIEDKDGTVLTGEKGSYTSGHTQWADGLSNEEIQRIQLQSNETLHIERIEFRQKGGGSSSSASIDVRDVTASNTIGSQNLGGTTKDSGSSGSGNLVTVRLNNSTGSSIDATAIVHYRIEGA